MTLIFCSIFCVENFLSLSTVLSFNGLMHVCVMYRSGVLQINVSVELCHQPEVNTFFKYSRPQPTGLRSLSAFADLPCSPEREHG